MLRSLKEKLRKFNVSVAECGHQDLWQRSTIGVVAIASDGKLLEQMLQTVLREAEKILDRNLSEYQIEYL